MSYKVQFLDDAAFEALPIQGLEDKVGFAHRPSKTAYVRKSGISTLDVFNAMHELDHLESGPHGEHSDHYDKDQDVYFKNFGNVLSAVAPLALSFLMPGVGTALGGALSSIGGGISGALGAIPGIGGALSGAASSIGNAAGGLLGIGGSNAAGSASADRSLLQQSASPGAFADRARTAASPFGGNLPSFGGGAAAAAGGGLGSFGQSVASNATNSLAGNIFGQGPMGQFQMPSAQGSQTPNVSQSPNMIAGASGSGSGGGPGASPGSVGGGAVSKLKSYIQQQQGGNGGMGPGGNF